MMIPMYESAVHTFALSTNLLRDRIIIMQRFGGGTKAKPTVIDITQPLEAEASSLRHQARLMELFLLKEKFLSAKEKASDELQEALNNELSALSS